MEENQTMELEEFYKKAVLNLSLKNGTIKKASKQFEISYEEAANKYYEVRNSMKKSLSNRAWIFLMFGIIAMVIGVSATLASSRYFFYGALLTGTSFLIAAFGYFRVALLKK
jgi:hypothetical protein